MIMCEVRRAGGRRQVASPPKQFSSDLCAQPSSYTGCLDEVDIVRRWPYSTQMATKQSNRSVSRRSSGYHHGDLAAALLTAAETELSESGIEGFSLRGVAKRAGVSHAAPAHHFRDVNGLLTALAAEGFRRFLQQQKARQRKADPEGFSQLVAAGMGYIDFATAHPALFRLMFSSERPDHESPDLNDAAAAAYQQLTGDVLRARGAEPGKSEPSTIEVIRTWAIAHGIADLMNTRALGHLLNLRKSEREAFLEDMLRKSLGA